MMNLMHLQKLKDDDGNDVYDSVRNFYCSANGNSSHKTKLCLLIWVGFSFLYVQPSIFLLLLHTF
jgi:hypothetical protein